jgi:hypothetical protein
LAPERFLIPEYSVVVVEDLGAGADFVELFVELRETAMLGQKTRFEWSLLNLLRKQLRG